MTRRHHEPTMRLLPWFVNDTLDSKEREQVLKHLAECSECRSERDRLIVLQQLIQEGDSGIGAEPAAGGQGLQGLENKSLESKSRESKGQVSADLDLSFRRTMKRIDESERNRRSVDEVQVAGRQRRRMVSAALAAGLGVFLIGAAMLFGPAEETYEYRTLTNDAVAPSEGMTQQMEIGFVDPIPVATLRKALIETGSNIVSGPDDSGVYRVEVVVPREVSQDSFLNRIQGIDGVKFASFTTKR